MMRDDHHAESGTTFRRRPTRSMKCAIGSRPIGTAGTGLRSRPVSPGRMARSASFCCGSCCSSKSSWPARAAPHRRPWFTTPRFPDDAALVDAAFGDAASLAANEPKASGSLGDLAPGLVIGRYVILAPLDEGGEALVYRVLHTELGKPFVLKLQRRPIAPGRFRAISSRPRDDCWPSSIIRGW